MSVHLNAGLFVSMLWPFVLVAIAWAVSVWALKQPDTQTELVRRLTGTGSQPAPEAHGTQREPSPRIHRTLEPT